MTIKLDHQDFREAKQDLLQFEEQREAQIRQCRDVIRLSKKVIYAVHRDQLKGAEQAAKEMSALRDQIGHESLENNMVGVAHQEYVEAMTYLSVVRDRRLPTREELNAKTGEYLLGLCDLCGELVRRGINAAARGDAEETLAMKQLVEDLFGEFLSFDLRNNELRKKSDSIKYHLNKLEDTVYDLRMHGRMEGKGKN